MPNNRGTIFTDDELINGGGFIYAPDFEKNATALQRLILRGEITVKVGYNHVGWAAEYPMDGFIYLIKKKVKKSKTRMPTSLKIFGHYLKSTGVSSILHLDGQENEVKEIAIDDFLELRFDDWFSTGDAAVFTEKPKRWMRRLGVNLEHAKIFCIASSEDQFWIAVKIP